MENLDYDPTAYKPTSPEDERWQTRNAQRGEGSAVTAQQEPTKGLTEVQKLMGGKRYQLTINAEAIQR